MTGPDRLIDAQQETNERDKVVLDKCLQVMKLRLHVRSEYFLYAIPDIFNAFCTLRTCII